MVVPGCVVVRVPVSVSIPLAVFVLVHPPVFYVIPRAAQPLPLLLCWMVDNTRHRFR